MTGFFKKFLFLGGFKNTVILIKNFIFAINFKLCEVYLQAFHKGQTIKTIFKKNKDIIKH